MVLARETSEFINSLPLTTDDNDRLIFFLLKQTQEAENGAFEQGFRAGIEFAAECEHNK